jgi:hypothetical protein
VQHRRGTLTRRHAIGNVTLALALALASSWSSAREALASDEPPTMTALPQDRSGERLDDTVARPQRWTVGLVLERGVHSIAGTGLADDQLFGLSTTYYLGGGPLGFNSRVMLSPNFQNVVNTRGVVLGGVRLRKEIFGVETFLGANAHLEARLRNHYWLTYVAPFEVGLAIFRKRSFRVEVYTGARAVVGGDLLDHFLIDPNGVNNAEATDALAAERKRPWEGYVSIVIGRAL